MNKILLILLLFTFFNNLKSQEDFKVYKEITIQSEDRLYQIGIPIIDGYVIMNNGKGHLFYEKEGITRNEMSENLPANITLRISDLIGNIIKDISIGFNDIDVDMAEFAANYFGDRKFLVITIRHRFYIIDLYNYKVTGPLFPKIEGDAIDASSGSLKNIKLFDDDKYLFGIATDYGVFCYRLLDLSHPIEIGGYNIKPTYKSSKSFFIDKHKDSKYNGIYVHNTKNEIDEIKYLFKSIQVKRIYEIDNQYILLKYFDKENKLSDLVIDYKNGRKLDKPKNTELIEKLLNKIDQ